MSITHISEAATKLLLFGIGMRSIDLTMKNFFTKG